MPQSTMNTPRRTANVVTPASKASRRDGSAGVDNVGRKVSFASPSESTRRRRVIIDVDEDDDDLIDLTSAMTTLSVGKMPYAGPVTPVKETFHEVALKATSALKRAERGQPNDFLNERWSDIEQEETKEEPDFSSDEEDARGESYHEECLRLTAELEKAEAKPQKKKSNTKAKKHERRASFHEEAMDATTRLKKAELSGIRRQPSSPEAADGRVRFVSPRSRSRVQRRHVRFHEDPLDPPIELKKEEKSEQRRRSSSNTPADATLSPDENATVLVGPEFAAAVSPPDSPQATHGPETSRAPALPNALRPFSMFSRLSWMMGRNFYGEA